MFSFVLCLFWVFNYVHIGSSAACLNYTTGVILNDSCYFLLLQGNAKTWDMASAKCKQLGDPFNKTCRLANFQSWNSMKQTFNAALQQTFNKTINTTNGANFWIGMRTPCCCTGSPSDYGWYGSTGQILNPVSPTFTTEVNADHEPTNGEACAYIYAYQGGFVLRYFECVNNSFVDIMCECINGPEQLPSITNINCSTNLSNPVNIMLTTTTTTKGLKISSPSMTTLLTSTKKIIESSAKSTTSVALSTTTPNLMLPTTTTSTSLLPLTSTTEMKKTTATTLLPLTTTKTNVVLPTTTTSTLTQLFTTTVTKMTTITTTLLPLTTTTIKITSSITTSSTTQLALTPTKSNVTPHVTIIPAFSQPIANTKITTKTTLLPLTTTTSINISTSTASTATIKPPIPSSTTAKSETTKLLTTTTPAIEITSITLSKQTPLLLQFSSTPITTFNQSDNQTHEALSTAILSLTSTVPEYTTALLSTTETELSLSSSITLNSTALDGTNDLTTTFRSTVENTQSYGLISDRHSSSRLITSSAKKEQQTQTAKTIKHVETANLTIHSTLHPITKLAKSSANCQFSSYSNAWSSFTACSATCGSGFQYRYRYTPTKSNLTCTLISQSKACKFKDCFPMTKSERIAASVLLKVACSSKVMACSFCVIIFSLLRAKSLEQILQLCQDISLLIAYLIIFFVVDKTENTILCKCVGIALQYFFNTTFGFMLLETLHIYVLCTNVYFNESFFSKKLNLLIGWGVPLISTSITAVVSKFEYIGEFTCWTNLANKTWPGTAIPIGCYIFFSFVCLEATNQCKFYILPNAKIDEYVSAKIMNRGLLFLIPLTTAGWFNGLSAMYYQNIGMYPTILAINATTSAFIIFFHVVGNEAARAMIVKIFTKLKQCIK